jgi:hypothetical protein
MNKVFILLFLVCLSGWIIFRISKNTESFVQLRSKTIAIAETDSFSLKKGDILVRPNWEWLPATCAIENGRMFGHVAVVMNDVAGKSVNEVLSKTMVIEAAVFDQRNRKFIFNPSDQIREIPASISFGPRFKGIRYRLRMNLTAKHKEALTVFLKNQLYGNYSVFSFKKFAHSDSERKIKLNEMKGIGWHCASMAWQAFYLSTGLDIDENKGLFIYPADIIASKYFDLNEGRLKF